MLERTFGCRIYDGDENWHTSSRLNRLGFVVGKQPRTMHPAEFLEAHAFVLASEGAIDPP